MRYNTLMADSPQPQTGFAEQAENTASSTQPSAAPGADSVSWSASEFVAHDKSIQWFINLGAAAVIIAGVIYILTRDYITAAVILFAALLLAVMARRSPKELQYRVDDRGIQVDGKFYGFDQFRSFSVVQEGAFSSLEFVPLKRFAPLLTVYYAPDHEEVIFDILPKFLPLEKSHRDLIDSFMNRIRF